MLRTAVGRKRRALWAILSCLFAAGFAVSAFMVHSEGNQALESVVERGRDEAQLATATLSGKELTKPLTGSTYDRVEALDGDPQDNLRRMREEFKARAEEAALRVKQREDELHEAASSSDPKR